VELVYKEAGVCPFLNFGIDKDEEDSSTIVPIPSFPRSDLSLAFLDERIFESSVAVPQLSR
jgi:hypothetical protein